MFSVIFQESFRFLIYLLLDKADAYLKKLTENEETKIFANKNILAYVVGLGFGLMSGAFSLVNVLAASLGPGTLGMHGEPHNFFIVSALMTLCMILLNTVWGVIFFSSLDTGDMIYYLEDSIIICVFRYLLADRICSCYSHAGLLLVPAEQSTIWSSLPRDPDTFIPGPGHLSSPGSQVCRGKCLHHQRSIVQ